MNPTGRKICNKCGRQLHEGDVYCYHCGIKIEGLEI